MNAMADPLGSSWSGLALQSCPELGSGDRPLYSCVDCVLDAGCPGKGHNLGRGCSSQPRHFQMRPAVVRTGCRQHLQPLEEELL